MPRFRFLRFAGFTGGVWSIRLSASSKVNGWSETDTSSCLRGLDMNSRTPFVSDWTGDAEAPASSVASASCYRGLENVGVLPVVEAPSELVQIERQIFLAHVVVRPDNSALQEAPKILDIVRVDAAAHVFALAMLNGLMRVEMLQIGVANIFVSRDQRDLIRDRLFNEKAQGVRVGLFDRLADDITLARYRTDHSHLSGVGRAAATIFCAHVRVAILLLSAKEGFINFDFRPSIWRRRSRASHARDGTYRRQSCRRSACHPL
jgi:hypothetical protein